ncbi:hypothetical protein ACLOJK_013263, partial [Asimina triloba]
MPCPTKRRTQTASPIIQSKDDFGLAVRRHPLIPPRACRAFVEGGGGAEDNDVAAVEVDNDGEGKLRLKEDRG